MTSIFEQELNSDREEKQPKVWIGEKFSGSESEPEEEQEPETDSEDEFIHKKRSTISKSNTQHAASDRCRNCAKLMDPNLLDFGFDICMDCNAKLNGMMCYNCDKKKLSHEFDNRQSVMCEDCFDRKPNWKWHELTEYTSRILYQPEWREVRNRLNNPILLMKMDLNILNQEHKVEQAERVFEELRIDLANLRKTYHLQGVVIDDIDNVDELNPADFNATQDPQIAAGLTLEYKQKKQNIIRKLKKTSRDRFEEQEKLTKLHKKHKTYTTDCIDDLKDFTATDEQVEDLYDLIINGEHTRKEILDVFLEHNNMKNKDIRCLILLDEMIEKYQIVSEGLQDLEKEIRAGKDRCISDLIKSIDPVKSWFRENVEQKKNNKIKFSVVYANFEEFVKQFHQKPMSKKAFSTKVKDICKDIKDFKYYKSNGIDWFRGISC